MSHRGLFVRSGGVLCTSRVLLGLAGAGATTTTPFSSTSPLLLPAQQHSTTPTTNNTNNSANTSIVDCYDGDDVDITGAEMMGDVYKTFNKGRAAKQYEDGSDIYDDIPDFTEYRDTSTRPVVFTPERPYPLWGLNLDDIGSQYTLQSRLNGGKQDPIVPIVPEKHGLPEVFVKRLEKDFQVTHLTPVQARALQHIYGGNDAAICAPTGSGKTFAFCVAALGKLMRDGPSVPNSILILTPSTDLCYQTERWLRKLWWYENDPRLCLSITDEQSEGFTHSALIGKSKFCSTTRRFLGGKQTVDERPAIMVATPEALLTYCESRKKVLQRTQPDRNFTLVPIFPYLSTVIIDEVDSVLPPHNDKAAGNVLVSRYLTNSKFQAPLQRIFVSATLSATTVNHVRRFLRKSLMAHKSAHLFETELLEMKQNGTSPSNDRGAAKGMSAENRNDGRGKSTSGSKASFSRLSVPDNVAVEFFSADRPNEQRAVFQKVLERDLPAPSSSSSSSSSAANIKALVVLPVSADPKAFVREVLHDLGSIDLSLWTGGGGGGLSDEESATGDNVDGEEEEEARRKDAVAAFPYNKPLPLHLMNERHRRRFIRGGLASQAEIDEYLANKNKADLEKVFSTEGMTVGKENAPTAINHDHQKVTFLLCSMDTVRGADIPSLSHLFLLAAPDNALELAHVVGRVGRMGAEGTACVVSPRSSLRHLNQYCDVLGIPFALHKRFKAVDTFHQRIVAEAREDAEGDE